jgi:hypothetical protein
MGQLSTLPSTIIPTVIDSSPSAQIAEFASPSAKTRQATSDDVRAEAEALDKLFDQILQQRLGISLREALVLAKSRSSKFYTLAVADRIRCLMVDVETITCGKCGARFRQKILAKWWETPDGRVVAWSRPLTPYGCSRCLRQEPQPKEGDTFRPKRRRSRGKFKLVGRTYQGHKDQLTFSGESWDVVSSHDLVDETLTHESLESWVFQDQQIRNQESQSREAVTAPNKIKVAMSQISEKTVRAIQKRWGLSYHSAREGKIGILRLVVPQDFSGGTSPDPQLSVRRMPRLCPHGILMHRDDRRGRSRHCLECYPKGSKPGRPQESPA